MYDIIGDVHGNEALLAKLLEEMGYYLSAGSYRHRSRKAIFVGDYIDRGPHSRQVVNLVKNMVIAKQAIALPGNHEFNFLCFHKKNASGQYLRSHSKKNLRQVAETERSYDRYPDELEEHLSWFQTLPLYFEINEFRVIHAAWIEKDILYLHNHFSDLLMTDALLYSASQKGSRAFIAIEHVLKGVEYLLPDKLSYLDNNNERRFHIRTKWWEDPAKKSINEMAVRPLASIPDVPFVANSVNYIYDKKERILFLGHYCLPGEPKFLKPNLCCLDYCVYRYHKLVAYRWNGEKNLKLGNLVCVKQ